jgi:hypothetical protein
MSYFGAFRNIESVFYICSANVFRGSRIPNTETLPLVTSAMAYDYGLIAWSDKVGSGGSRNLAKGGQTASAKREPIFGVFFTSRQ